MNPSEIFSTMHPDEMKAKKLMEDLVNHCQEARLPMLVLVGLVESKAIARGWSEFGNEQTREIMRDHVRSILWPGEN